MATFATGSLCALAPVADLFQLRLLHDTRLVAEVEVGDGRPVVLGGIKEADLYVPRTLSARIAQREIRFQAERGELFVERLHELGTVEVAGRPLTDRIPLALGWTEMNIGGVVFTLQVAQP